MLGLGRHAYGAAALLVLLGLLLFPGAGRDDAYLTYWPAYSLCHEGAVLNFNGDRIEQSSSLLHVLLLAGACRLGLDVPVAALALGVACGALAVLLAALLALRLDPGSAARAPWLAGCSTVLAYWSFGKLESTLAAVSCGLWLLAALAFLRAERSANGSAALRAFVALAVATVALLLVRPEMALVTTLGCALLAADTLLDRWLGRQPDGWSPALRVRLACIVALVLGCALALALLRKMYFGSAFPQPVAAKHESLSRGMLRRVLTRDREYLQQSWPFFPLLAVALFSGSRIVRALREPGRSGLLRNLLLAFCLAYAAFVLAVGGDWMEGGRFWTPLVPLLAALAADGLGRLGSASRARGLSVAFCVVSLVVSVAHARYTSTSVPLWQLPSAAPGRTSRLRWFEASNRAQQRDEPLVLALEQALNTLQPTAAQPVSILLQNSGMVGYELMKHYLRRVHVIDMHGLSDRFLTGSPLRARLDSWPLGLRVSMPTVVHEFAAIQSTSRIERPSFLVWHQDGGQPAGWPEAYGYRTLLEQHAQPLPAPRWGALLHSTQYISIDAATFTRLGSPAPVVLSD